MANPRDLAEQAFALLQNALSDSEARASELDEQLKRKRQPKNRLEEQLDVLTHRLEKIEAERQSWEQKAGHLEEVAEAERVKVAQLKKKLEIAEAGPEKLTKKEINFWRARAEAIDTETKDYKDRLAALRRDLNDRDAAIERLEQHVGTQSLAPATAERVPETDHAAALRTQLEQRDRWLADLRLELHELRAQPTPPLEIHAEVETLRAQLTALERAAAEEAGKHVVAEAELTRLRSELTERERALREATAAGEHVRTTLAERDHRLVQISAELEQLRQQQRTDSTSHRERIAANEREIERQRQLLAANEADFRELEAQLARRDGELDDQRRTLAEREHAALDGRRQLEAQSRDLGERERELRDQETHVRQLRERLTERDQHVVTLERDLDDARTSLMTNNRELEHARAAMAAHEREVASLRDTLITTNRELDQLREQRRQLETAVGSLTTRLDAARTENTAAREQIAGLEGELKEEREQAESLGELANERREHMTKLEEQLEETEERLAESNWRLGKSQHFARIVKRRKGLVQKLLEALRAKMKANVALKAGLDGLRTFKAGAEQNQQKLLQRIDKLKAELREAEEAIKKYQSGTAAKQELATALARTASLEERLNTQAELIQSLETELKTARLQKASDENGHELERLRKELETKNQVIAKLGADAEEQQRKAAKLRGTESETMRLRALTEKDRSEIETLQQELANLRQSAAAAANGGTVPAATADLEGKLKERDGSITRLMGTIKEHEATIKKLTESADSWKRKYQFLASDSPDPYKAASGK